MRNKLSEHHNIMKLEIKVDNISQIKQISKCLPKDLLSNAVLNGGASFGLSPEYFNIFWKKEKCLNKMFILNKNKCWVNFRLKRTDFSRFGI